jgi:hypothetical protein
LQFEETETKHKDLTIEIERTWKALPIIIRATGTISKSFRKYLSNIQGNHKIKELQKAATLGTAHILCKVLMQKYKIFNIENNIMCTMNSNYRIAATLFFLQTWFVSGI